MEQYHPVVWVVGPGALPAWMEMGASALPATPETVPRDADLVLVTAPSFDEAIPLIRATAESCPRARLVALVPAFRQDEEIAMLRAGAALVLVSGDQTLSSARMTAFLRYAPVNGNGASSDRARQAALLRLASTLLSTLHDEEETFDRLVDIVARELRSQRVSLMQVNREAGYLQMRSAVGLSPEVVREARARIGEGIAGTCALLGKPLFVDDHMRARDADSDLSAFVYDGEDLTDHPMSLTVPILVKGEVVGVVNVTDRVDNRPYSSRDIEFISSLMAHAGYLFENQGLMAHLEAQRAFSDRVMNTLTDPLVVVDANRRVVRANDRFVQLFSPGVTPQGASLWSIVSAPVGGAEAVESALAGRPLAPRSLADWEVGGRIFDVIATRLRDGAGAGQALIVLRDMTTRRQMERRLVSAEKMASLGVLAAGVAHEINNPIAFVKANAKHSKTYFVDLLEIIDAWRDAARADGAASQVREAEAREAEVDLPQIVADIEQMVGEMIEGIERVENIVLGLKSFAHPDTQMAKSADLTDLVRNAVLLTQGKWKYKLTVEQELPPFAPIYCLPTQLEQVFMNLIVNAAQAAKSWGTLRIVAMETEVGVRIDFSDTCGGIPPEIVGRIFEPFFTTKDIGEGTGLGLAISYNIIEGHGGTMTVTSETGAGTCFTVELPRGESGRPLVVKQHSRFRI